MRPHALYACLALTAVAGATSAGRTTTPALALSDAESLQRLQRLEADIAGLRDGNARLQREVAALRGAGPGAGPAPGGQGAGAGFPTVTHTPNGQQMGIGPEGAKLMPFSAHGTLISYHSDGAAPHPGAAFSTVAVTRVTTGSGKFGVESADYAAMFSAEKRDPLRNPTDGEVDGVLVVARQGPKGDTAGLNVDVSKTRLGQGGDSGGVTAVEIAAAIVDGAGTPTLSLHAIPGFLEGAGGVAGETGYGFYTDARKGEMFSAFHADTYNEYRGPAGSYGYRNAFTAGRDRDPAGIYFQIVGDRSPPSMRPGDVIQGSGANRKILRTDAGGTFRVRNASDTADLLSVGEDGVVTVSGTLRFGEAAAGPVGPAARVEPGGRAELQPASFGRPDPASALQGVHAWLKAQAPDGTAVFIPAWR